MSPAGRRERGAFALIHADPVILFARSGEAHPESALWSVLEALPERPTYLVLNSSWTVLGAGGAASHAAKIGPLSERFDHVVVVTLCPTAGEAVALQREGLATLHCSGSALIREDLYAPAPGREPKFDAIYDAKWAAYKRHDLAGRIQSLALIAAPAGRPESEWAVDYLRRAHAAVRHATWISRPYGSSKRWLSPEEINAAYNQARVGLCLSRREGHMYASIQYLLAGLPIVTTPNLGGRDEFFDPAYVRWARADPEAVAGAVEELVSQDLDPQMIRDATLTKVARHRERLQAWIRDAILAEGGEPGRWGGDWPRGLPNKLSEPPPRAADVIAEIEQPEKSRQAAVNTASEPTPTPSALAWRLQRLAVRTGAGPLRPLWALAHSLVIRIVARRLTAGSPGCEIFLKGGFGFGRPVYGLSDIDAIVVAPDQAAREEVERCWRSLAERNAAADHLFQLWIYERRDVARLEHTDYLIFGLDAVDDGAAYFGAEQPRDPMALLDHPGLYGPGRDWRRLGSRRRAPVPLQDPLARERWAWFELRFLWGLAFRLAALPPGLSAASSCQTLVADAARVWLWLEFGEQGFVRDRVLRRAIGAMPDEEESLHLALALGRSLPRRPRAPVSEALGFLARISARVADRLVASSAVTRGVDVELGWGGPNELLLDSETIQHAQRLAGPAAHSLVPLADWRSLALPALLDLALVRAPGQPSDPSAIAELAAAGGEDLFPALRQGSLLVLPTTEVWHRGRLRGIECPVTDPVSFALLDGAVRASFPELPGWSATDCSRRAVAEHRAWLAAWASDRAPELPYWLSPPSHKQLIELCGCFSAARAALFADSLRGGSPELAVTAAAVARRLADADAAAAAPAAAACEELARCRSGAEAPDPRIARELRRAVEAMPAYRPHNADALVR